MVPDTGVLLNDEMDDFSAKPGAPNVYGLVGGEANAIAPGKRPLSSMTPTFLENERGVAILGTPGGSRIISMMLLATLDFAAGHGPDSWVNLKRFHHQFLPDVVQYEPGALTPEVIAGLEQIGHDLKALDDSYGNMQAIFWDRKQGTSAASDPRGISFSMKRQPIGVEYDEHMIVIMDGEPAVDEAWLKFQDRNVPFPTVVANVFRELAKLNPQSAVHARSLYSGVNVIRRAPPGPVFAELTQRPYFVHVGDLYWRFDESRWSAPAS